MTFEDLLVRYETELGKSPAGTLTTTLLGEQLIISRKIAQNKTDIKALAEICNGLRHLCQINKETTTIVVDGMSEMAEEVDTQLTALRNDVAARFPSKR